MSHPRFFSLGAPAVIAAGLLLAPAAWAGGGGHGGGGGGHGGGGAHGGAVHGGAVHGGGGGFRGGYGYNRGFGYGGYGFGIGLGLGYPYGYGYGYGGYADPYAGYGADYYAAPYGGPSTQVYVAPPAVGGPAAYPVAEPRGGGGPASQDVTAHVMVKVPADAEVWFGQGKTQQTGTAREFVSPALSPGKDFTYDIKARWTEDGKEVVQTRRVDVSAGAWKTVDFTKPAPEVLEAPKPKP